MTAAPLAPEAMSANQLARRERLLRAVIGLVEGGADEDLQMKDIAERADVALGTVYRYEKAGELLGLTRVRGFTQDDAHIFCTPEEVKGEFLGVLDLVLKVFATLGLKDYRARIGVRDPKSDKYVGDEAKWALAERQIEEAAADQGTSLAWRVQRAATSWGGWRYCMGIS